MLFQNPAQCVRVHAIIVAPPQDRLWILLIIITGYSKEHYSYQIFANQW